MRIATTLLLTLMLAGTAFAQPEREDVIWARDIGDAEITLDGLPDEDVWSQAETINLVWGENAGDPGSSWRFHGETNVVDPDDPINATIRVLRKGNQLYVAADVPDKSIGGSTGLWNIDGLIMTLNNVTKYDTLAADPDNPNLFPGNAMSEFIYAWWHQADTTDAGMPTPGTDPRLHGEFGSPNNELSKERPEDDVMAWEAVTVVDGTANDDDGEDVGYTMETRIDLERLGYDATGGEVTVAGSFTIYDTDWQWPVDAERRNTAKVWFQNQWGNNLNEGAALIKMSPDVTLDTAELPGTGPDMVIPNIAVDSLTLDGFLDEAIWQDLDYAVQFKYKDPEANAGLPSFGPTYTSWFRPGFNNDGANPVVVDPSTVRMKFFHDGPMLYVGVDVDDQAVSGALGEGGDGISLTINHRDSLDGDNTMRQDRFIFNIDSTGIIQVSGTEVPEGALQAGGALKSDADGNVSTPADPTDVDAGYTFEIALNLVDVLGYSEDLDDGWFWFGAHLFDSDNFEDPANDYTTRTWWLRERTTGPGVFAFLEAGTGVANEGDLDVPSLVKLLGNFPNPLRGSTTVRYQLDRPSDVTLHVYDVLGRPVANLSPGRQGSGRHEIRFDASRLASGPYLYRLETRDGNSGHVRSSALGRMIVLH